MKVLTNTGWSNGKLVLESVDMKRGEIVLIEIMFLSIGEDFDVKLLRNPDWRYKHSWNLEQKAVWAAQAYRVMRENSRVRNDLMNIRSDYAADVMSVLYKFGNEYGFRQDRSLRHASIQNLIRRGNTILASPVVVEDNTFFGKVSRFIEDVFGGVK